MDGRSLRPIKTTTTAAAGRSSRKGRSIKDPLKVVYISSPMKVRTSASNFRSLVQQLTGKNSDIAQYMDSVPSDFIDFDSDERLSNSQISESSISREESPSSTSLNSLITPIIDYHQAFMPEMEEQEQFSGDMFLPDFSDFFSSEFDLLGSYEEQPI